MEERPTLIVTGASRGLGAEIASSAAHLGADLVLSARSLDRLQAVAATVHQQRANVLVVAGDISHAEDCEAIVHQALDRFGRIDGLVNNAGQIEPIARVAEVDLLEWQQNWATNLLGPLMLTQLVLPELRKRNGRVINISSGTTTAVIQGWGAYSTSKAGLDHFTRILAAEEPEITALVFRPGIVDTDMQAEIRAKGRAGMSEVDYNRLSGLYEQGRLVPVELPGRAVAILALRAPHDWSGQTVQWDDEPVQKLL